MSKRALRGLSQLLYAALLLGAAWLTLRFLLPWLAPFLLALGIAALMEPPVRSLCRRGLPRGLAAGLITLGILALLGLGLALLISRGLGALTGLADAAPALVTALGDTLSGLEERALVYVSGLPGGSAWLKTALDALAEPLYQLPAALSRWLLEGLSRIAQHSPDVMLFLVTAGLGSYFLSASFPRARAFAQAQLSPELSRRLAELGRDLKLSFGGWFRAQLILMVMTFLELLLAFWLLGVRGAGLLAGVTALIDALPVFGTGFVLLPWAAGALLLGNAGRSLGLVICWVLVNLLRSCTQAKLLGDQIGLDPLSSLLAIYLGWKLCGVWGLLLFPLLFVSLQQLNDRGLIRLWKTP